MKIKNEYIEINATKEISEITHKRFLELPQELQEEFKIAAQSASISDNINGGKILTILKTPLTVQIFAGFIINEF